MDNLGQRGFVVASDKELKNQVTSIDLIRTDKEYPIFKFYIGARFNRWFMHNDGNDIVITYGSQIINLGKLIEEVKEFQLTIEDDQNEVHITRVVTEWLPEDPHPIQVAVFNTNLACFKRGLFNAQA